MDRIFGRAKPVAPAAPAAPEPTLEDVLGSSTERVRLLDKKIQDC